MNKTGVASLDRDLASAHHVILDFASPGCAPCKKVPAQLAELLAAMPAPAPAVFEVNIAEEPAVAQRFFVLGVPTLIVFRDGKELARFNSVPKLEKLQALLQG